MNTERDDERVLEDYLRGDTELSRLYREGARERPSAEVDARVLARARRAGAPARRVPAGPFATRWALPLSLAAVVVLSVSLVLLVQDPELAPPPAQEARPRPAGAPEADAAREDAPASGAGQEKARREGAASGTAPTVRSEGERPAPRPLRKAPEQSVAPPPAADVLDSTGRQETPLPRMRRSLEAERAPPAATRAPASPAAAPGDAPEAVRAEPQAWLRFIEGLAARGDEARAVAELGAFRERYPAHPLTPRLRELAGSRPR